MTKKDAQKGERVQGIAFPEETLLNPEQRISLQRYREKLGLERKGSGEAEWRPAVGFESRYEVSNRGEVRSAKTGRKLERSFFRNFYWVDLVQDDGKRGNFRVHLLVYRAFIDPDYESLKARLEFLDGDRGNLIPGNIRPMKKPPVKKKPKRRGLPEETLRAIETHLAKGDLKGGQIAIRCGVSQATVSRVKTGKMYRPSRPSASPP